MIRNSKTGIYGLATSLGFLSLILISIISDASSIETEVAVAACDSEVQNLDKLTDIAPGEIIFVGEMHGSDKTPVVFGDLVCRVATPGQKILVGLEFPQGLQTNLDVFLNSSGTPTDQEKFFSGPEKFWSKNQNADGHSSEAMFALVERLRKFKAAGIEIDVVAFQPSQESSEDGSETQEPYEFRLANLYMDRWKLVTYDAGLILVCNVHAIKSPFKWSSGIFKPMATYMPLEIVLTFDALSAGGSSWNCQADRCGSHPFPSYRPTRLPERVEFEADERYDGKIYIGPTLASPPMSHSAMPTT